MVTQHLKHFGVLVFKRDSVAYRLGRATYRWLRPVLIRLSLEQRTGLDNAMQLAAIARASSACRPKEGAKRIVFLTVRGWPVHLATETMLAARLRQMGHEVSFLICADSIPFCMFASVNRPEEAQRNCVACGEAKDIVPAASFESDQLHCPEESKQLLHRLVAQLEIENCRRFEWEGFPYGELVYPSIVWFLRRSRLTKNDAALYRKALVSAHATRVGLERMVAQRRPDTVVMLNGDFNVEQVAGFVLKRLGLRYVTHDYTFHERLGVAVNASVWDDLTFSDQSRVRPPAVTNREQSQAEELLQEWRRTGGYQGDLFWNADDLRRQENTLRDEVGLDARPIAAAYTNLTFESSVTCKDRAFANQFEWLSALVGWFGVHHDYQLAIRVHPAEVREDHWRPNESLFDFIATELGPLPDNVHVIAPGAKLSSYELGSLARVVLVYSSTLGLEMADRRKRVITAAHAHYAGRGFTCDPATEKEYFAVLEEYMKSDSMLSEEARSALVDYVGWFMFRRLQPFEPLSDIHEDWPRLNVKRLRQIASSKLVGFQNVCRFIADDTPWW
jgi:hypothetical protein